MRGAIGYVYYDDDDSQSNSLADTHNSNVGQTQPQLEEAPCRGFSEHIGYLKPRVCMLHSEYNSLYTHGAV